MQVLGARRDRIDRDGLPGVADQALPEVARGEQVGVVLERDPVAAGELPQLGLDAVGEVLPAQAVEVGLAEVHQRVTGGVLGELGEPDRMPVVGQVVVDEPVDRRVGERRDFALEQRPVGVGAGHPVLGEELVELLRLGGVRGRIVPFVRARVPVADVTQHAPEVAAGVGVEGDVGDAVLRQAGGDGRQQRVTRVLGHPAVDAVGDDVVELAQRAVDQVAQIALAQLDVAQPGRGDRAPAFGDRLRGQIDPGGADARGRRGHRHQVAAGTAADLQHARVEGVGRDQAVQDRDRREPLRMRLSIRIIGVSDGVIDVVRHRPAFFTPRALMQLGSGTC